MSLRHIQAAEENIEAAPSQKDKLDQWSPAQLAQEQVKESTSAHGESRTAGWNPAEVWRDRIKR